MKKIFALVIAVVLVTSLAVPGFAAEARACNHTWGPETVSTQWKPYNDSQCEKTVVKTKVCTKCAEISRTSSVSRPYHSDYIRRASCDGTTQTHVYHCINCDVYRFNRWVKCPGPPELHRNGCQWLPM